jgi:putative hydrolase of the HAD superfamily
VSIKAIGFDLDGTLYPEWRMNLAGLSIALRQFSLLRAFSTARTALREGPHPGSGVGELDAASAFRFRQAEQVAGILRWSREQAAEKIDEIFYGLVERKFEHIRPFRGVVDCLSRLESRGVALGVLSDLPPQNKLKFLGLDRYFSVSLCAEDFGCLKPSPEPFLGLAKAMGFAPEEMLFVGNKQVYDIQGAKAVGMKAAYIGSKPSPEADFSFRKWPGFSVWVLSQLG